MKIQIFDKDEHKLFEMVFAYEVDEEFVSKLIKLVAKHKINGTD